MPARRSRKKAVKKSAKKTARKSVRKRTPAKATRAKRTTAKSTRKVARRRRTGAAAKPAKTRPTREPIEAPSAEPERHEHAPWFDPKAERMHEHVKKMRGVESQMNEERHAMTRHRKNQ